MPDLSLKAVHQFWYQYPDPSLYKVISFMESVEDCMLDGQEEVEQALKALGDALESIGNIDLQQEEPVIHLVCHIKMGRALRILMCLDQAYPGAASKVLSHAETITQTDSDVAGIFLRRNMAFERLRLLGRVFASERMKLLIQVLEEGES